MLYDAHYFYLDQSNITLKWPNQIDQKLLASQVWSLRSAYTHLLFNPTSFFIFKGRAMCMQCVHIAILENLRSRCACSVFMTLKQCMLLHKTLIALHKSYPESTLWGMKLTNALGQIPLH